MMTIRKRPLEVFQYLTGTDIRTEQTYRSTRLATKAWIEQDSRRTLIEGSGIKIDEGFLDADGRTVENFNPNAPKRPA